MKILFWGFGLFFLALFIHLLVWKIKLPRLQTKALLYIFFWTLAISIAVLFVGSFVFPQVKMIFPQGLLEYLHISLFFISLALAYITTYSAVEVDSPSLVMILHVSDAGPRGLEKESFENSMTDDILVRPRVNDLLRDNLIFLKDGKYKLTPKGILFIKCFIFYRNLLRAGKGG